MKNCPNCDAQNTDVNAKFCCSCGFPLDGEQVSGQEVTDSQDLDFVVTETKSVDPEFVGGNRDFSADSDDIEPETPSSLMEEEALRRSEQPPPEAADRPEISAPIGDSHPHLPPEPDCEQLEGIQDTSAAAEDKQSDNPPSETGSLKRLSDEELKSIEKDFYSTSDYLSENEKSELIGKIDGLRPAQKAPVGQSAKPIPVAVPAPGMDDLPGPKMAERSKGIAFFYKNYVEVVGGGELHDGDDIFVNGRYHMLRPKSFNPRLIAGSAAAVFAVILLFVGSLFIGDSGTGKGEVVGMLLTKQGVPSTAKATIRFPDADVKVKSNSQGFFKSGKLPVGPQKVEWIVDGKVISTDFAAVSENQLATLTMIPAKVVASNIEPKRETRKSAQSQTTTAVTNQDRPEVAQKPPTRKSETAQKPVASKPTSKTKSSKSSTPAKLTLAANVEGARLMLDGQVKGAGNLTYSKLKPGTHTYSVTKDGYQEATGKVTLKSGKSKTLKITLSPLNATEKAEEFDAEDYYYSGVTAYKQHDYQTAVKDLSEAIQLQPSYADACFQRAQAHAKLKDMESAFDDYIRAAEIYQIKKRFNNSITAYGKAVELNPKSLIPYIGRGNLYLNKGQEIAAIADFEAAVKIDKRNFSAQYGLGEARFRQSNYKKAVDHFKKAKALDSKNPLVYQYLMLSYMGRDDFKNVKKSFDKFKEVANEDQYNRFLANKKYSAVLRVVEN